MLKRPFSSEWLFNFSFFSPFTEAGGLTRVALNFAHRCLHCFVCEWKCVRGFGSGARHCLIYPESQESKVLDVCFLCVCQSVASKSMFFGVFKSENILQTTSFFKKKKSHHETFLKRVAPSLYAHQQWKNPKSTRLCYEDLSELYCVWRCWLSAFTVCLILLTSLFLLIREPTLHRLTFAVVHVRSPGIERNTKNKQQTVLYYHVGKPLWIRGGVHSFQRWVMSFASKYFMYLLHIKYKNIFANLELICNKAF